MKDKVLFWVKLLQGASTIVSSFIAIFVSMLDEDEGTALKDHWLLPLQILAFVLVFLYGLIWYIIPWIVRKVKWAKFKIKYGVDLEKINKWYDENKDKKLSEVVEKVKKAND